MCLKFTSKVAKLQSTTSVGVLGSLPHVGYKSWWLFLMEQNIWLIFFYAYVSNGSNCMKREIELYILKLVLGVIETQSTNCSHIFFCKDFKSWTLWLTPFSSTSLKTILVSHLYQITSFGKEKVGNNRISLFK